ncbi:MAG: response regulator transcription factor [Actinomycetota bacterium]|nr:response regulator transcription factor [Actinomycetota bacterium]
MRGTAFEGAIRVLVADDNVAFCKGIAALLRHVDDVRLVGTAHDADTAVNLTLDLQPDVVLMDVEMPGGGHAATARIAPDNPQISVLMFSMHDDDDSVLSAVQAGARGYLLKGARREQILRAVRTVADGGVVFGPGLARQMLALFTASDPWPSGLIGDLTEREREVLALIAEGRSNEQIAEALVLERGTVRNHASNIFRKLQVRGRGEAIAVARDAGVPRRRPR